ncbi:hypothetical protein IAT40_004594 [Kwoniella sp. CBS 6097]
MSITDELIIRICSFLPDRKTLLAWCLASRKFRAIGEPALFRQISLSPWKSTTDNEGKGILDPSKADFAGDFAQNSSNRLKGFVRTLSLREHRPSWYSQSLEATSTLTPISEPKFQLPNLEILHLYAAIHPNVGYMVRYTHALDSPSTWQDCPLLTSLRPKIVLIRAIPVLEASNPPDAACPEQLWTDVEQLIVIVPAFYATLDRWQHTLCTAENASNLKAITWIIDPTPPPAGWDLDAWSQVDISGNYGFGEMAVVLPDVPITIVNFHAIVQCINLGSFYTERFSLVQIQLELRKWIEEFAEDWSAERLDTRINAIKVISLDEYYEGEEWRGIFEPGQMDRWNRQMNENQSAVVAHWFRNRH